jgi:hypothetical protein
MGNSQWEIGYTEKKEFTKVEKGSLGFSIGFGLNKSLFIYAISAQ